MNWHFAGRVWTYLVLSYTVFGCIPPRCPDALMGLNGRAGCRLAYIHGNQILTLERIRFSLDEDTLLPESIPSLEAVAQLLHENPQLQRVLIEGHTDAKAGDAYNDKLSRRRARAVRQFLIAHGISAERLCSVGYGRRRPLLGNESRTEEEMVANRRIEFTLPPPGQGETSPCPPNPSDSTSHSTLTTNTEH